VSIQRLKLCVSKLSCNLVLSLLLACLTLGGCAGQAKREDSQAQVRELIFVAGASGRVGRYVIRRLKDEGRPFRSLTTSKAKAIERWGDSYRKMNWVEGDVRDSARMQQSVAGATRVICVVGAREATGPNGPEFVDYGGVVNLVEAAKAAQVEHFVLLTAIGVTDPEHPFNKATQGALQWRFKGEEHLRNSGLSYTIVRPAGLVNRPAGEQRVIIEQGDNWQPLLRSTLSRDDLSQVLIESLANAGARNATFEIANDPTQGPGDWRLLLDALQPDQP
jgi:uncharacterized protein YbjT (DUF2867 family)